MPVRGRRSWCWPCAESTDHQHQPGVGGAKGDHRVSQYAGSDRNQSGRAQPRTGDTSLRPHHGTGASQAELSALAEAPRAIQSGVGKIRVTPPVTIFRSPSAIFACSRSCYRKRWGQRSTPAPWRTRIFPTPDWIGPRASARAGELSLRTLQFHGAVGDSCLQFAVELFQTDFGPIPHIANTR